MAEVTASDRAQVSAHVHEPLHRPWLALTCVAGVLALMIFGIVALPREGSPLPAIARYAAEIALPKWKITEVVNEVVYGTRGFDTFGETFLLLAAVVSVSTLARARERRDEFVGEEEAGEEEQEESDPDRQKGGSGGARRAPAGQQSAGTGDRDAGGGDGDAGGDEDAGGGDEGAGESRGEQEARRAEAEEAGEDTVANQDDGSGSSMPESTRERYASDTNPLGSEAPERSEAMTVVVRVGARTAAAILVVASVYLFARGFTPGGGFPAGAALSGVALLLYASLGYRAVSKVVNPEILEPIEMFGALIVVGIAVAGFFLRGSVMANWIQLAPVQTIASGGLLQAFSSTEFLEVATGLTIAIFAMLGMKHDWTPDKPEPEEEGHGDSGDGDSGAARSGPGKSEEQAS